MGCLWRGAEFSDLIYGHVTRSGPRANRTRRTLSSSVCRTRRAPFASQERRNEVGWCCAADVARHWDPPS
jgi:hypothetical protein